MSKQWEFRQAKRRFTRAILMLSEKNRVKRIANEQFEAAMKEAVEAAGECKALQDALTGET